MDSAARERIAIEIMGDPSGGMAALRAVADALAQSQRSFDGMAQAAAKSGQAAVAAAELVAAAAKREAAEVQQSADRKAAAGKRAQDLLSAMIAKGDPLKETRLQLQRELNAYKEAAKAIEGGERQKQEALRAIRQRYAARFDELRSKPAPTVPTSPTASSADPFASTSRGAEDLRGKLRKLNEPIEGVRSAIGALGVTGNTAVGVLSQLAQGIINVGGKAGLIGAGLVAAGAAASALVEHVQEVRAADRAYDSLAKTTQIAESELRGVEGAWKTAGAEIDSSAVPALIKAGREAGLTTTEIAGLGDEAIAFSRIGGGDFASGFTEALGKVKRDAAEALKSLRDLNDANELGGTARRDSRMVEAERIERQAKEERDEAQRALDDARKAQQRGPVDASGMDAINERIRLTQAVATAEAAVRTKNVQLHEAGEETKRTASQLTGDVERERLKKKQEDEDRDRKEREREHAQHLKELSRLDKAAAEEAKETERKRTADRFRAMLAGDQQAADLRRLRQLGGRDELLALEKKRDEELAVLEGWNNARLASDHNFGKQRLAWDAEYTRRRELILSAHGERVAEVSAADAEKAQQIAERRAREDERRAKETKDKIDRQFKQNMQYAEAGSQAGFSFVAGLRQAAESGEAKDTARVFVNLLADVLSMIPGVGGLLGGFARGIGSLFHVGGTADARGERMPITAHVGFASVDTRNRAGVRPGTRAIDALAGESVLSPSATTNMGGPSGVARYNRLSQAGMSPGGGGITLAIGSIRIDGSRVQDQQRLQHDLSGVMRRALISATTPELRRLARNAGVR